MSVEVPIPKLFDEIGRWGFGYLLTVSEGERVHLLALHPTVVEGDADRDDRLLRFDAGGGRACRNAAERPDVSIVFPPHDGTDGMSLVVDGTATVRGELIDVTPTWAVLHRAAPPAP